MTSLLQNVSTEVQALSSKLLSTLDESIFFTELSKFFKNHFEFDKILIYRALEDGSTKLIIKNNEYLEDGTMLMKGVGPSGHVIKTGKSYFSNDIERDPTFDNLENREGVVAELSVPISHEGIIIAIINFQLISLKRHFDRDDITFVLSILSELKNSIANMKMYLSAKSLNEVLLKKVAIQDQELAEKEEGIKLADSYKIKETKILGKSVEMKKLLALSDKLAITDINAIILGDGGVGKEMIARRVHCRSLRSDNAFISIDISSIPPEQLEEELFGRVKDNLKGIVGNHGIFEISNGGTVFLDKIEKTPKHVQSKLANFIKDGICFKVGAAIPNRYNVRILAATSLSLDKNVNEGSFNEDLYNLLNVFFLKVPSLKDRKDDIEFLASYFLNMEKNIGEQKSLSPGAINCLKEYPWPGNVRELIQIMERAYILSDSTIVEKNHLADSIINYRDEIIEDEREEVGISQFIGLTLNDLEKKHICHTLEHLGGNKTKTARSLGITVKTLYNKLHNYGMVAEKES